MKAVLFKEFHLKYLEKKNNWLLKVSYTNILKTSSLKD